ncbi:MAG: hypothetical protein A2201_01045 [Alicyclobacillus sp. RIFOXYA1_FULL_53_8]|nr:MAG: hypothetical protein A2201_01045 [Alicyclobacillus sp. RIFOXYA1_FULL_53_8]
MSSFLSSTSVLGGLFILGVGPFAALFFFRRLTVGLRWLHTVGIGGAFLLVVTSIFGLLHPRASQISVWQGMFPFISIHYRVDSLTNVFTLLIGVVGLFVSVYAVGYLRDKGLRTSLLWLLAGTSLFLATMVSVILAGNIFTFLLSWESMALVSFLLVMYEHERSEVRTAGYIYLAMTHIGTIFITIGFFILAHSTGSYEFVGMAMKTGVLPAPERNWVFVLALIGFGTKAGLIPFHIWLPRAHPVAPSHVSALMSAVMLKTAVFGFLLLTLVLLPAGPWWWGALTAGAGAVSAFFGILYAASETDLKRMLAYSSIENLGLIFLGIGVTLVFRAQHQVAWESLALAATLYHSFNHGIFKSLLFLGAGAVIAKTHVKRLDSLGGLIGSMPWTALFMLVGVLSISALPPFNGFAGEWMWIQALFGMAVLNTGGLTWFAVLLLAALTLTGAVVAMTFVRMFGFTFLALPRTKFESGGEVNGWMKAGMGALALLCVLLGLTSAQGQTVLGDVAQGVVGDRPQMGLNVNVAVAGNVALDSAAHLNLGRVGLVLLLGIAVGALLVRWLRGKARRVVLEETWNCGGPLEPRMTYSATGFTKPIRVAMKMILRSTRELQAGAGEDADFPTKYVYSNQLHAFAESHLYRPFLTGTLRLAQVIRRLQNGQVQSYLGYLFVAVLVVLLFASEVMSS